MKMKYFCLAKGRLNKRQGKSNLPLKKIWPGILWGCAAAGIFSFVSTRIETELLKKLFGVLLLLTGLRELFYRPRKPR